jgi:hypothetical protein
MANYIQDGQKLSRVAPTRPVIDIEMSDTTVPAIRLTSTGSVSGVPLIQLNGQAKITSTDNIDLATDGFLSLEGDDGIFLDASGGSGGDITLFTPSDGVVSIQPNGEIGMEIGIVTGDAAIGFYGATPVAKQTGVAVTAEGIHAALVALGLIGA